MKRWLKITLYTILSILVIGAVIIGIFIYQVNYGLPFFDHEAPEIKKDLNDFSILIFSKTNGFRHGEAIDASLNAFDKMADDNGWSIVHTENGAIFNAEQLALFDVVVWNNVTGKVLTDEQRSVFETYIENGGGYVGIHGAGDFSHHWKWYNKNLIGASFSHHPMSPQLQNGTMISECQDNPLCKVLPSKFSRMEEWYVFYDNPRDKGFKIWFTVDEATFNPSGQFGFLQSDKNWGMGADHPVVWSKCVKKGRTFYSALGHTGDSFKEKEHLAILESGIRWSGKLSGICE